MNRRSAAPGPTGRPAATAPTPVRVDRVARVLDAAACRPTSVPDLLEMVRALHDDELLELALRRAAWQPSPAARDRLRFVQQQAARELRDRQATRSCTRRPRMGV